MNTFMAFVLALMAYGYLIGKRLNHPVLFAIIAIPLAFPLYFLFVSAIASVAA